MSGWLGFKDGHRSGSDMPVGYVAPFFAFYVFMYTVRRGGDALPVETGCICLLFFCLGNWLDGDKNICYIVARTKSSPLLSACIVQRHCMVKVVSGDFLVIADTLHFKREAFLQERI